MLKITRSSNKPVSRKNNNKKPAFEKNNNNNKVDGFDSSSIKYTKKSKKSKS